MNEILGLFKNVKGGPVTSIIGGTLMLFAGFMMYKTGFDKIEYGSVSVGIMVLGILFLLKSDDGISNKRRD
jgi:uncharacterized protein YqgC (DUF456 family)